MVGEIVIFALVDVDNVRRAFVTAVFVRTIFVTFCIHTMCKVSVLPTMTWPFQANMCAVFSHSKHLAKQLI